MTVADAGRAALRLVVLLVFVALAGATYQGVITAFERRQFPRPGRMVDVGDYQLHIVCSGAGTPVVVLEAPAAGPSAAWGSVQPALASRTRVCSYDRAGLGWSETQEGDFDPGRAADDLRALLEGAGEKAPYVLVGHGLGASLAQVFAARAPQTVRALVLVDPPSSASADSGGRAALLQEHPVLTPWLARVGLLRVMGEARRLTDGYPEDARGALTSFLNRPDHLTRSARELRKWDEATASGATAALPPDLVVERVSTGHASPVDFLRRPDDANGVVEAVRRVAGAVR